MRRAHGFLPAAAVAAVAALAWLAPAAAHPLSPAPPAGWRPVVLAAGPVVDPSDRTDARYRRVTFSPDGDGRNDRVTIRFRAQRGDVLSLWLHPASRTPSKLPLGRARGGVQTATWDGLRADGTRFPDGAYVLRICDLTTRYCSTGRVLAHLRVLTVYAPVASAVSAGETIPVQLSTDRKGPFRLDLVSAADPGGEGVGAVDVAAAGRIDYRIPDVPAGGLWLLRVRSGDAVTHFPLVVHEPTLRLDDPPPSTALVVYPYLTWRAYDMADTNRDGVVDSWYAHPLRPVVPLYGPFEPQTIDPPLIGREPNPDSQSAFAQWLHEHRLRAEHVTDVELARIPEDVLRRYAEIVFEGHTEYYERPMYDDVLRYRDAGGRLYFLQGNSFYGEAAIRGSSVVRVSYRYRTRERSDFALAVTGFRSCCWPTTIRPVYHLRPGAVEALPWAFAGTTLKDGDAFGIAAGEVDTVDPALSPPGTLTLATATIPPFTPVVKERPYAWLGSRRIPYPPSYRHPQTIAIAYARVGNGEVFSWGDTGFLETLRYGGRYQLSAAEQATLDRVALNVWEHFAR